MSPCRRSCCPRGWAGCLGTLVLTSLLGTTACKSKRPLIRALINLSSEHDPSSPPPGATIAVLEALAERTRNLHTDGAELSAAKIAAAVFSDLGFRRDIDSRHPQLNLLPAVVRDKKGSCVGLVSLLLALGEILEVPMAAVLVPQHTFVRSRGARQQNIEMLRRGEIMPDAWYLERYQVPANVSAYMRPLTADELAGVVHYNLGNLARRRRQLDRAASHFERASKRFPSFPPAYASLGLVRHLAGDLEGARSAYDRAQRLFPALPGLANNKALLEQEAKTEPSVDATPK